MSQSDRAPQKQPWTVPVALDDIPDAGGHYTLSADAAAREGVARLAGLRDLRRLEAEFDLARHGSSVAIKGEVKAKVGQICVVTLEPIESEVAEQVDLVFAPPVEDTDRGGRRTKKKDAQPEPLVNGVVDLGVVATEFLILGLDPYPRKEGAQFAQPAPKEGSERPFAALAALKKSPGNGLK